MFNCVAQMGLYLAGARREVKGLEDRTFIRDREQMTRVSSSSVIFKKVKKGSGE